MAGREMHSLWMLGAALSFSLMAACVKLAAQYYGAFEILFYRCLFSTALIAGFILVRGYSPWTPHWLQHARRAGCGTFSMAVWYYTLGVLPIATSVTLNYSSPVFIGILVAVANLRQGKSVNRMLYVALMAGFAGVVTILRPTAATGTMFAALLGVLAAFVAAFAFQDVKRLTQLGEPEWRLVFYFSLYSAALSLPPMLVQQRHAHSVPGISLLGAIGALGMLGQLAVSRAYGRGNVLVSACLQYSGVVFAAVAGIVVWGEALPVQSWIGVGIVIAAGVLATVSLKRN